MASHFLRIKGNNSSIILFKKAYGIFIYINIPARLWFIYMYSYEILQSVDPNCKLASN